jgi:hypothetical protein
VRFLSASQQPDRLDQVIFDPDLEKGATNKTPDLAVIISVRIVEIDRVPTVETIDFHFRS